MTTDTSELDEYELVYQRAKIVTFKSESEVSVHGKTK